MQAFSAYTMLEFSWLLLLLLQWPAALGLSSGFLQAKDGAAMLRLLTWVQSYGLQPPRWSSDTDPCGTSASCCSLPASTPTNGTVCSWSGICCNAGLITSLDLSCGQAVCQQQLKGPLPSDALNDLHGLQSLKLRGHLLDSGFDAVQWDQLSVRILDLSWNKFEGDLPQSPAFLRSQLATINLSHNSYTGALPDAWSSINTLKSISLTSNALTGAVPDSWSQLTSLTTLDLSSNCGMCGDLPTLSLGLSLSLTGTSLGKPCDGTECGRKADSMGVMVAGVVVGMITVIIALLFIFRRRIGDRYPGLRDFMRTHVSPPPRPRTSDLLAAQQEQEKPPPVALLQLIVWTETGCLSLEQCGTKSPKSTETNKKKNVSMLAPLPPQDDTHMHFSAELGTMTQTCPSAEGSTSNFFRTSVARSSHSCTSMSTSSLIPSSMVSMCRSSGASSSTSPFCSGPLYGNPPNALPFSSSPSNPSPFCSGPLYNTAPNAPPFSSGTLYGNAVNTSPFSSGLLYGQHTAAPYSNPPSTLSISSAMTSSCEEPVPQAIQLGVLPTIISLNMAAPATEPDGDVERCHQLTPSGRGPGSPNDSDNSYSSHHVFAGEAARGGQSFSSSAAEGSSTTRAAHPDATVVIVPEAASMEGVATGRQRKRIWGAWEAWLQRTGFTARAKATHMPDEATCDSIDSSNQVILARASDSESPFAAVNGGINRWSMPVFEVPAWGHALPGVDAVVLSPDMTEVVFACKEVLEDERQLSMAQPGSTDLQAHSGQVAGICDGEQNEHVVLPMTAGTAGSSHSPELPAFQAT